MGYEKRGIPSSGRRADTPQHVVALDQASRPPVPRSGRTASRSPR